MDPEEETPVPRAGPGPADDLAARRGAMDAAEARPAVHYRAAHPARAAPERFRENRRRQEEAETRVLAGRRPAGLEGLRQAARMRDAIQEAASGLAPVWERSVKPRTEAGEDDEDLLAEEETEPTENFCGVAEEEDPPEDECIEVEFSLFSDREIKKFCRDPAAFVAAAARKGRTEVNLRKCTAEQQK
eukprot:3939618-Lingulodinium_polyedra.AAC.1